MVKIRLRRTGAKKQPNYRVVVTNSRSPRDGRFIEIIGHYNPRTDPETVDVQEDRALSFREGLQVVQNTLPYGFIRPVHQRTFGNVQDTQASRKATDRDAAFEHHRGGNYV